MHVPRLLPLFLDFHLWKLFMRLPRLVSHNVLDARKELSPLQGELKRLVKSLIASTLLHK
jgi:hypothetical protein